MNMYLSAAHRAVGKTKVWTKVPFVVAEFCDHKFMTACDGPTMHAHGEFHGSA